MDIDNKNKPIGWRAKIGVITPTENTITEPEFNFMKPSGVTVHFNPERDNFKSF